MNRKLTFALIICLKISHVFAQENAFEQWKIDRKTELVAEDGWVNLIGLTWFDEKSSYLNLLKKDSLGLSDKVIGKNVGTFQFIGDSVWFFFNPKLAKKKKLQSPAKVLQYPVADYGSGGVYYDRWKWSVINRGGQFAMRLRDLEHPGLTNFSELPYFEYDSTFAVSAFFQPSFNETMDIPNVLGQVIEWKVLGVLKFRLEGKEYELTALDEAGKFFVIFSDLTNASQTYPTGRYLYVSYPDGKGYTILDFNFSYNPPCAFTAFATCPIPPKENRLTVAIQAGEKLPTVKK